MSSGVALAVAGRLRAPDLARRVLALGFEPDDAAAVLAAAARVVGRPELLTAVGGMAERLTARVGRFDTDWPDDVFADRPAAPDGLGTGVLPMLALLGTAPDVAAYHASRGVPADVSAATLSDLGQQVWVHRLTSGEFGLHTYGWLTHAWSGALFWLGRLQFGLARDRDGGWLLDTHIPRTSPRTGGQGLDPAEVDRSFSRASSFFARHFADHPAREFSCRSWLLDPALAEALPGSRLAAFAQRWRLTGEEGPGDADALFFVFGLREAVEVAALPTDTALRRVVVQRLRSGGHWRTVEGRLGPGGSAA